MNKNKQTIHFTVDHKCNGVAFSGVDFDTDNYVPFVFVEKTNSVFKFVSRIILPNISAVKCNNDTEKKTSDEGTNASVNDMFADTIVAKKASECTSDDNKMNDDV